mmetsp:Transcript_2589/g.8680  ORF Transcript_2589/g.8680 Transcript_2589/m.8680 type:complete len:531 (+) Transcript_2589:52-1644(+)
MGCNGSRGRFPWEDPPAGQGQPSAAAPQPALQQGLLQCEEAPAPVEPPPVPLRGLEPEPVREREPRRKRIYYIDWMRVVAIYLVVVYHVVQALDWVGFFDHVTGMKRFVVSFRATALQVGMPMFFHISGRAQALSPTVGFRKTLLRRAQRLLLPFAVCYVLLVPPWQYIDKEYDWSDPSSFHMKANPITWLKSYYTTARFLIYFDLAWLWFLPALYGITLLSTPLILLAERYKGSRMRYTYCIATILLWAALLLGLVWGCGFSWRFGLCAVLGPGSAVLIAQVAPLPPQGGGSGHTPWRSWFAVRLVTLAQIAASVGLVLSFGYAEIDPPRPDHGHDPRAAVPFLVLCLGFYVQGYFTQRWSQGSRSLDGDKAPWWVWLYRLFAAFVLQVTLMVSTPSSDVETGHFIYPIYSTSYKYGPQFGAVHVLGTWCYIGVFVSLFQAYGESIIAKPFYKHATKSTIVVYIFHWVFVKVFAFWMLNPTLFRIGIVVHNVWTTVGLSLLALLFAVSGSLLVYSVLLICPCCGRLFGL